MKQLERWAVSWLRRRGHLIILDEGQEPGIYISAKATNLAVFDTTKGLLPLESPNVLIRDNTFEP